MDSIKFIIITTTRQYHSIYFNFVPIFKLIVYHKTIFPFRFQIKMIYYLTNCQIQYFYFKIKPAFFFKDSLSSQMCSQVK
jgi:hypothetical protein